jgi:hypothetical protein
MLLHLIKTVATSRFKEPLTEAQSWTMAADALLTTISGNRHDSLSPFPIAGPWIWKKALENSWGVADRKDAIAQIKELITGGHRISMAEDLGYEPLAWDLCRAINVARWSYAAAYFTEEDAWRSIATTANLLQPHYDSWTAMAVDYVAGHDLWNDGPSEGLVDALKELTTQADSPWLRIAWGTDLGSLGA